MTVSYQYDVASSTSGGFIRLLFRWRGSVWKLVYRELVAFTIIYFTLTMLYRFVLTSFQKQIFERIVFFCSTFMDLIPLSFVLGFYVSFIASRWWSQYQAIPWPDKIMNSISLYVPGADETSRVLRRTLMRYLNVALVLVLRSISMAVKRRFPTREHLVEAGFMTRLELEMLQSVPSTEFNTFWIPCTWFVNLLREAKQEARITDSNGLKLIMEEFNEFRSKCGMLWGYDWISMPLVYTQVVTLATYAFFGACIFGRQYVDAPNAPHRFELYIPVFTIFQLLFYMGLLKVAEQLINPFGDDDEDFELNWIIDRHMKVSYLGVDLLNTRPPPLTRDNYFYEQDMKLPYTEASLGYKKKTYRGSVARMHIPQEKQNLLVPEFTEDDDEDRIAATFGMGNRGASLWTLVGGKLNTRFSVSNQNLDQVSLESGSGNWKVSNPSLFNFPIEDLYMEQQPGYGVLEMTPTETPPTMDNDVIRRQSNHLSSSQHEVPTRKPILKKGKLPGKRKLIPHLKKKARNAQKGWIAFQSSAPREAGTEAPLSLIHKQSKEKLPSEDNFSVGKQDFDAIGDKKMTLSARNLGPIRRQSFDVGHIALARRASEAPSLRFQSLPDVQQFVAKCEEEEEPPERDNDSTSNLLMVESEEDDTSDHSQHLPPQFIFTRASLSPTISADDEIQQKDQPGAS